MLDILWNISVFLLFLIYASLQKPKKKLQVLIKTKSSALMRAVSSFEAR